MPRPGMKEYGAIQRDTRTLGAILRLVISMQAGRGPIFARVLLFGLIFFALAHPVHAEGCAFEAQGEGRVAAVIDARSFRLEDGREIRLAGLEQVAAQPDATSMLAAIISGRMVALRGEDDTPDRYGRQPAFVFVETSAAPVQALLLAQGTALFSGTVSARECASILTSAEAEGRAARRGIWANPSAIKNSESPGDILAGIGQFVVVEGRVLSVRQAGATTYLNFGRSWTRDFAVIIPRRTVAAFETAEIALKSLENKRIRVRGFVESRPGPRIEVLRVGQIELLGGK
jgi:endonuclease YncB( thermonuclease family)